MNNSTERAFKDSFGTSFWEGQSMAVCLSICTVICSHYFVVQRNLLYIAFPLSYSRTQLPRRALTKLSLKLEQKKLRHLDKLEKKNPPGKNTSEESCAKKKKKKKSNVRACIGRCLVSATFYISRSRLLLARRNASTISSRLSLGTI